MNNDYEPSEFVLVFRTNIHCGEDLARLTPILNSTFGGSRWSVDLSDVDRVLRIETSSSDTITVIEKVTGAGFICEELLD